MIDQPTQDPGEQNTEALEGNTEALQANTVALGVTPEEAALVLAGAVKDNTKALNRATRRSWLAFGMALIVALSASIYIWRTHDLRVSSCRRDNELRQTNLDLWRPVLLQPVQPLPTNATPEDIKKAEDEKRVRDQFEATLNNGFKLRNCDDLSWL